MVNTVISDLCLLLGGIVYVYSVAPNIPMKNLNNKN